MDNINPIRSFFAVTLILSTSVACTSQIPQNSTTNPSPGTTPTRSPIQTPQTQPDTKTDTLSVEGEKREITLKLYDQTGLPFTTYIPADNFVDEIVASGEGTSVWFYFKKLDGNPNKEVYVQFFFPSQPTTPENLKKQLLGNNGLFSSNQWQQVNQEQENLYPWAREKIVFQKRQDNRNTIAAVFIGEHNGTAFWVAEHYPGEYGDGFAPLADKILTNLQLRSPKI